MLAVQSLDVAQSLALGMNPMMVAIQQGGQVAGIYAGQGGVSGAFREAGQSVLGFARSHPLAIAAVVALTGVAFGLRSEMEEVTGASLSLGHVVTATMQELLASVNGVAAPAIALLSDVFDAVTDRIYHHMRDVVNVVINGFDAAYRSVLVLWGGLPGALADLMYQSAQTVLTALSSLVQGGIGLINNAIETANRLPSVNIPLIGDFNGFSTSNPYAGHAAALGGDLSQALAGAFSNDPAGDFFLRSADRAMYLARAADQATESLGSIGRAASQAGQPMDLLNQTFNAANDNMRSWSLIGSNAFSGFFQAVQNGTTAASAFEQAWTRALDSLTSRLVEMATNTLVNQLFGGFGGGFGAFGGSPSAAFGPGTAIPIYHSGTNFVPETGPAILQRGEAVIPANMNRAGYNNPTVDLRVTVDDDGRLRAFVENTSAGVAVRVNEAMAPATIDRSVAATGGAIRSGKLDGQMGRRFGVSQTAKVR